MTSAQVARKFILSAAAHARLIGVSSEQNRTRAGNASPAHVTSWDALLAGVGAAFTAGAGFAFTWLVARAVGPDGSGFVAAFGAWFLVLMVVGKLGLDTSLVWLCSRSTSGVDPAGVRDLMRWASSAALLVSVGIGGLLLILAPWIAPLALDPVAGADPVPLVRWAGLALPVAVVTLLALSALRGMGLAKPFFLIDQVVKPGVRLAVAAGLVLAGVADTMNLAYAWLWSVPIAAALSVLAWVLARPPSGVRSASSRRELFVYARSRAPAQLVDVLNASAGVLILSLLGNAGETGLFSVAMRLVVAGQLSFTAFRLLVAPVFAHLLAVEDLKRLQVTYEGATTLIVAIAIPVYALFMAAPQAVLAAFGEAFVGAWPMLVVMACGAALQAALGNLQTVVLMSGASHKALIATLLAFCTNAGLTLLLYPAIGGMAAAVAWSTAISVEAAVLWRTCRRLGLRPASRSVRAVFLRASAVALPTFLLLGRWWEVRWWPGLTALALVGAIVYVIVMRKHVLAAWTAITSRGGLEQA